MDFVDEQDIARFQIGEQRGQVAGPLDHRPRGLAQIDAHLGRDDVRQSGLAESWRPEQQDMIQRLPTRPSGLNENFQLFAHRLLADVLGQPPRSNSPIQRGILAAGGRGNQTIR